MRLRRSIGFQLPGSASAMRGGWEGGNSFQPAIAGPAAAAKRSPPKNHASSLRSGSHLTWGTMSPHFCTETREVQRSSGSETWVSLSMTLIRSTTATILLLLPRPAFLGCCVARSNSAAHARQANDERRVTSDELHWMTAVGRSSVTVARRAGGRHFTYPAGEGPSACARRPEMGSPTKEHSHLFEAAQALNVEVVDDAGSGACHSVNTIHPASAWASWHRWPVGTDYNVINRVARPARRPTATPTG